MEGVGMIQVEERSPSRSEADELRALHGALKSLSSASILPMSERQRDMVARTYAWLCAGAALALLVAILDDDELPLLSFPWAWVVTVVLAARAADLCAAQAGRDTGPRGTRAL
jgi:hypothetical protein